MQAKEAEELDKKRPRRIAGALDDCSIMNWKAAKFVSASGGESLPSKCGRFTRATNISLLYEDSDLMWAVTLEPVVLNGKRLIAAPPSLASVKK